MAGTEITKAIENEAVRIKYGISVLKILSFKQAEKSGFWETCDPACIPEKLMLVITELAEAMEFYRKPIGRLDDIQYTSTFDEPLPVMTNELPAVPQECTATAKPDGLTVELADAIIRIMDLCGALHLPIEQALVEKMLYNSTRPHKHGKNC